jgi:hypothetical protein
MRSSMRKATLLVMVTAGCVATPRSQAPPPQVNLSGFSAAFKQGYGDGCEHARSLAPRKDERRYQRNADYAAGWNDGYGICRHRSR